MDVSRKKMVGRDGDRRRKEKNGEGGLATVRRGMDVKGKEIVVRGMSGRQRRYEWQECQREGDDGNMKVWHEV